jgi:two-component system, OmpR family, phosphate regulon sensor histidine kinase PhoR
MNGGERLRRAVRAFAWVDGDPDPRVLHTGFVLLVVLDRLLRRAGGVSLGDGNWPLRGAALALLILLVVMLIPRSWHGMPAIVVLAVADLGVVGVSSFGPYDGGTGLLVVLPALWLGSQLRVRGALIAVAATFLLITLPVLTVHGLAGEGLSRLVPLPIAAGLAALALSAGLDLAELARRRAEEGEQRLIRTLETLEAERQASQEVFDAADVGLMLLDEHGQLVGMNRRYEEFITLSVPDDDLPWPGNTFAADGVTRLTADQLPSARVAHGAVFEDYRMWSGADPATRRAVSVSGRRSLSPHGNVVGGVVAATDITELMRALAVKDEFVASVSHELRTPLTSIVGYIAILLEDEDLAPRMAAQLRVVERNAARLTALVEALLQEAHHADGILPMTRREVDLARIAAASVDAAGAMAQAGGVELESEMCGSAQVVADPERLAQVVDNLVSNAIKHTPPGGRARVAVRQEGERVELSVSDNGIGISEAEREQLFTRFFRTRAATESAIQGVGLGLSITKAIVESHGGHIEVDSECGRGSVFRVWLPVGTAPG